MSGGCVTDDLTDLEAYRIQQRLRRGAQRTKSRGNEKYRTPFQLRDFVGVDGEGVTRNQHHEYVLLRAGERELHRDGKELSSFECLDFISSLDPEKIHVGYYFDYDVTKMLQHLPAERIMRLLNRQDRVMKGRPGSYWPVDWGPFAFDYLKGKEFSVRKNDGPRITISDVGSFFQASFVKTLKLWFSEEEWREVIERIQVGKDGRATFGGLDTFMKEYCHLEINMLQLLMSRFRDVCYALNLHPTEWQGPGRLVSAVLKREGYPSNKETPIWETERGEDLADMANSAYYGGRFEAGMIGDVRGPIYQYDINSAYPSVYRSLPCLKHGKWVHFTRSIPTDGSLFLADFQFTHDYAVQYCALPVRTMRGTLLFPLSGRGIYWSPEIAEALPYLSSYTVRRGYRYVRECDCEPFKWVEPMYLERKKLGKSGKGIVLKLALNSTYGKLCQSIGMPTFANPIHASLITSTTRAQLYSAMMKVGLGRDVIMAATDGIFTLEPRDLPTGSRLGEWEESIHSNIFVVQSGVYYIDGQIPKTRGTAVSRLVEHEREFRALWEEYLPRVRKWKTPKDQYSVTVPVSVTNFISLPLAFAWRKPHLAGEWLSDTREIAFEWFSKRTVFMGQQPIAAGSRGTHLVTRPQETPQDTISIPYKKSIGGVLERIRKDPLEMQRVMAETQPDWNPSLDLSGIGAEDRSVE